MRFCTKCGVEKDTTEFYKKKGSRDGLSRQCKRCHVDTCNERRKQNWEQSYDLWLKYRYGVDFEWYTAKLEEQGGTCAICLKEPTETLCLDHDHKTGKPRGLLCRVCNAALGQLGDSAENLKRAFNYLEKHKETQS